MISSSAVFVTSSSINKPKEYTLFYRAVNMHSLGGILLIIGAIPPAITKCEA